MVISFSTIVGAGQKADSRPVICSSTGADFDPGQFSQRRAVVAVYPNSVLHAPAQGSEGQWLPVLHSVRPQWACVC